MVICQSVHPHMSLGTCDRLLSLLNDGGRIQQKWVHAQSFSDSVHCVKNDAYCLASILPFGVSNHYPPHLLRVSLAPCPPRPFFTLFANSGNFLDISFILHCVLSVGCDIISDCSILR